MSETASRMLALLSLLQSPREWPGRVLAERLDVTTRTVRRDVERLRELGYEISAVKGPDGGYRLAAGAVLPPLLFDDDQAMAIAVGLQSGAASTVGLEDAAARALSTVRQVMPSPMQQRMDRLRFTDASPMAAAELSVLEAVSGAVRARRTLRFEYGGDEARSRVVEPHGVVVRSARWYLVAWEEDRGDWRVFRLDRIVPKTGGGVLFTRREIPTGDARTFVAMRFKGSGEVDSWPCEGEFEIALPASAVAPWIGDGDVEPLTDGACRVRVGSWSWSGLLAWAMSLDAPFTVRGPREFIETLPVLAARIQ